jgi:peptidoglycan/LPS O-acetylase OafA/YrhL
LLRPSPSNNVKDYVELVAPNIFTKIFYFFTGLGHQVVIVFFVLSGFWVGGSVLRKGSQFSLLIYGLNRMTRLWTVLVPSLLFTAISDTLTARFSPDILSGDYLVIWNSGPNPEIYPNSVLTLLGNLFFLQTVSVPVFGINSPL